MAKNREDLLRMSEHYASKIGGNLAKALVTILKKGNGLTVENISRMLGVNTAEINGLLRGNLSLVSLPTLSKLFVLTGQALDVKPVDNHTFDRQRTQGDERPSGGVMLGEGPSPAQIPNGARIPQDVQPRDARGRFVRRSEAARRIGEHMARPQMVSDMPNAAPRVANRLLTMTDEELINIIESNMWDSEIDLMSASRDQMIGFIMAKERIMADGAHAERNVRQDENARPNTPIDEAEQPRANAEANTNVSNAIETLFGVLGGVLEEARKNPEIASALSRLIPRRS